MRQRDAYGGGGGGQLAPCGVRHRGKSGASSKRCRSRSTTPGVYLVVAAVALGCYVNGLHGDFVHDDIPAITQNKDVLGVTSLTDVFRNDFWGTPMSDVNSHKSYRPFTTLTFRLSEAQAHAPLLK